MRDYTKIEAWKLADDLTIAVYETTRSFPREELFGLTSQLRRATYSVPANIAEGSSRDSKRDYPHFLYIARGSLSEAQYFVHLARRLGYVPDAAARTLDEQVKRTFACLHGLTQSVEKEAGAGRKIAATITRLLVLGIARWSVGRIAGT